MTKGTLYLIPSVIGDGAVMEVMPEGTLRIIRELRFFIVEEIRTARRFLIKTGIPTAIDDLSFSLFNEHSDIDELESLLKPVLEGHSIGLLSEAGVPCVADPGALVVRVAHFSGIKVVPLTGPSSILLSLMASGFNGQNFAFTGYLPADKILRKKRIKELEHLMITRDQTQIFIETPYRNHQLFEALVNTCNPDTLLCVATELTSNEEKITTLPIRVWKSYKHDFQKKNSIFLLYHE